ncbi:MAG: hypothetical protein ABFC57_12940 [Veillonellales bacterium]
MSGNELLKIDASSGSIDIPGLIHQYVVTSYSVDGAIAISPGIAELAKTSAAVMTIAAPTTAQDGTIITILNSTAYAHVVTFTGGTLVNGTSAAKTTATFPANVGGSIRIIARGGKWYLNGYTSVTLA